MSRSGHLVAALTDPGFRRLLATRLVCQFGDGVFQASLAGAVLFDPEHQAHASDVAAGFTVLLLPYSLIGPFAGVLLDRWWRQRVLVLANVIRAIGVLAVVAEIAGGFSGIGFYASALVIISLSRFVLSALSAAQPHVVADVHLVTANAVAATGGAVIAAAGGGVAIGLRALIGDSDSDYALIATTALVPYLLAATIARAFPRVALGPSDAERAARETPAEVARGLVAGGRHLRSVPPAANALAAIGVHRLFFGIWTVCGVLLYRNYFTSSGVFRAGVAGLGQTVAALAIGAAGAALVTPVAFRRLGAVRWPTVMLAASAIVEIALGLVFQPGVLLAAALLLGFTSQAVKISVDTLVQHHVVDAFRGRVFAIYDMLFNVALVLAAVLTAVALPENGRSPAAVIAISTGWALTALIYFIRGRRTTPSVPQPPDRAPADRAPSAAPADAGTPLRQPGRVGRRAAS
jgi:MFS family permease